MDEKRAISALSALAQETRLGLFRLLVTCGPAGPDRDALSAEYQKISKFAGVPPGSIVRPRG